MNLHAALNNELPTPYAGGGSSSKKNNDTVLAHFSTPEVHAMTVLQGHKAYDKKTGAHDFSSLGKDLSHPLLHAAFHHHARNHYASGGDVRQMAHAGRFGDNQVAVIPRSLADHLDSIRGGSSINPTTGHREYFDFGGMFGKLASGMGKALPAVTGALKSAGPAMASRIAPMASKIMPAASGMMGSMGSMLSRGASAAGNMIKQNAPAMINKGKQIAGQLAPVAMQYGQQYLQNKLDPANAQKIDRAQMFHDMTGAAAPSFGEGNMRRAYEGARSAGNTMIQGGNARSALQSAVNTGTQGMEHPAARAARSAADAYANNGNARNVMAHGIQGGAEGMNHPLARIAQGAAGSYLNGQAAKQAQMQPQMQMDQEMQPHQGYAEEQYQPEYDEQFAY